jgi:hypothetical protein
MVAIVVKKAAIASGLFIFTLQCLTLDHGSGNSYRSIDSGVISNLQIDKVVQLPQVCCLHHHLN